MILNWTNLNGILKQAIEQLASITRFATIEAERVLVQVISKVFQTSVSEGIGLATVTL